MSQERPLAERYAILREYLANYTAPARSPTRDKLMRMPVETVLDVSMDTCDEVNRRLMNSADLPFLPVRSDFPQQRNQSRQKMATLPEVRMKEMAWGVYSEIERRFPRIAAEYEARATEENHYNYDGQASYPSQSRQPQHYSDDQHQYSNAHNHRFEPSPSPSSQRPARSPEYQAPHHQDQYQQQYNTAAAMSSSPSGMRSRDHSQISAEFRSLRKQSADANERNQRAREAATAATALEEMSAMKNEYEYKITLLEKQLRIREAAEDRARQLENDLLAQVDEVSELKKKLGKLNSDYDALQEDFDVQQKTADSIRSEATGMLTEVKTLTAQTGELTRERDILVAENKKLRAEIDLAHKETDQTMSVLEAAQKEADEAIDELLKLKKEADQSRQEIARLQTELQRVTVDRDELKNSAATAQKQAETFQKENAALQKEVGSLKKEVDRLRTELSNAATPRQEGPLAPVSPPAASAAPAKLRVDVPHSNRAETGETSMQDLDSRYRSFEKSMDQLISAARNDAASTVLVPLKAILMSCKSLISDSEIIEEAPATHAEDRRGLRQLKDKLQDS
eukprot:jgi/Hompol1/1352/HPOL_005574-RA